MPSWFRCWGETDKFRFKIFVNSAIKKSVYDYVIIGSGFGGSVSAMRLSEKGYSVAVLEKGKRYRTEDFPKTNWNLRKYLWMPKFALYGIQCMTLLRDVFILHGAGVGGGSLVYANTLLVPPDHAMNQWGDGRWAKRLPPFFTIAKRMLGVVPSPVKTVSDSALEEIISEYNYPDSFAPVDVGVYFGEQGKTVSDPYFDGEGPDRAGCTECGGCMVGCRENAKNTLDKNYLYFAEKNGAVIIPETEATLINENPDGIVSIDTQKSTGFLHPKKTFYAKNVILSGGVLGTVKLLKKSQLAGLSNLPDSIGKIVRTNSETLIGVVSHDKNVDHSKGIAISSQAMLDEQTQVELVRYGAGQDAMGNLGTVLTGGATALPRIFVWLSTLVRHPIHTFRNLWPIGWAKRSTILLVMQSLENYLHLSLKRSWTFFGKHRLVSARNTKDPIPSYIPQANKLAERMAKKLKGRACSSIPEAILDTATTAHILGGCILGDNPKTSVVDETLKIHGKNNLYVIDGSVIPGNLGVNPSLTITAMAEWAMSLVKDKDIK